MVAKEKNGKGCVVCNFMHYFLQSKEIKLMISQLAVFFFSSPFSSSLTVATTPTPFSSCTLYWSFFSAYSFVPSLCSLPLLFSSSTSSSLLLLCSLNPEFCSLTFDSFAYSATQGISHL